MSIGFPRMTRPGSTLLELLTLEEIDRDLYRATTVFEEPHRLCGGQVLAQALLAAGGTVPGDRPPHSLHGYFLRGGDPARPTIFKVDRDRDGRSFSARRVVAVQDGAVILSMSASFHVTGDGLDRPVDRIPEVGDGLEAGPSLDHSMWFHRSLRMDDWVLVDLRRTPSAAGGGCTPARCSPPTGCWAPA